MSEPLHYERSGDRRSGEQKVPVEAPPRYARVARHVPTELEFLLCATADRMAITLIQQALGKERISFIRSREGEDIELVVSLADREKAEAIAKSVLSRRQRVKDVSLKPSPNEPDPFNNDRFFVGI